MDNVNLVQPMTHFKSTKGTHVYKANDEDGCFVSVLYVQRNELPSPPPKSISLTITHEGE